MKIELSQRYKSIATLTCEDLPDFAVLIGRNGAGKTQLLDALKEGEATTPDIAVDEIEKYDMVTFRPPNSGEANRHANQFGQITADAYLLTPPGGQPPIETAAAIFYQFAGQMERDSDVRTREDFERTLRDEIRQMPDFTVLGTGDRVSPYQQELYQQVLAPLMPEQTSRQRRRSQDQPKNRFNGNQAVLLSAAMKIAGTLPHELTHDDIMSAAHYEGDTLSNTVSEVFAAYKVDQYIWAHKRVETQLVGFDDLIAGYRTKYPPPWETLREILSVMREAAGDDGLFDFDFSDPDEYELHMGNYERFTFTAEMTNRTTGTQYELTSLSSGEKVLMALCLVSFNQYLGRRRPKLFLLDELDAVLHPSMIAALVRTLKTLFVPQGAKILMTSHSPMTVAALDEADIFRVVRTGGHVNVSRTTKSEAIEELSEGLASIDAGLKIAAYDGAKVTVLTEGHNAKHIKRWVELNFPGDVRVFEELEQYTNDNQLLAYGRLLGKMHTNTHFVIVWDCDAANKAETLRRELPSAAKLTPFAFKKREDNTIAPKGIENNYDESVLEPYSTTTTRSDGTVLGRGFQSNRKTEFANHVLREGTPQNFTHFQDLHNIVSRILESAHEPRFLKASEQ